MEAQTIRQLDSTTGDGLWYLIDSAWLRAWRKFAFDRTCVLVALAGYSLAAVEYDCMGCTLHPYYVRCYCIVVAVAGELTALAHRRCDAPCATAHHQRRPGRPCHGPAAPQSEEDRSLPRRQRACVEFLPVTVRRWPHHQAQRN